MKVYPAWEEFLSLGQNYNLIPVYSEILADMDTPVSAYCKVAAGESFSFLLESVEGGERWASHSFIGMNPLRVFKSKGNEVIISTGEGEEKFVSPHPLEEMKKMLQSFKAPLSDDLGPFYAGAAGFIGYDMVRFFEKIPCQCSDDLSMYDAYFFFAKDIILFENLSYKIKVISNVHLSGKEDASMMQEKYDSAKQTIETVVQKLNGPQPQRGHNLSSRQDIPVPDIGKGEYMASVEKAKEYIKAGDVIQVVLSRRYALQEDLDVFDIYRALRTFNPSPYMFYFDLPEMKIAGASPEVMVRVQDRTVQVRPIAGTRMRGKNRAEDLALEEELLADPKEIAEHIMLLDLGRNDLGRIAKTGTVEVTDKMVVERYSHVMHIVSHVLGEMRDDVDVTQVVKSTFPAGTLSGAPKVRAMEIIEELEKHRRGIYGGAIGYFDLQGNSDLCIAIRMLYQFNNCLYFQAGAGIVFDSQPELEYQETVNKAKALFKAIQMVRDGLVL